MNCIENLLCRRIGLDPASIGAGLIARVVRLRMKSLGLEQMEAYERILSSTKQEWDELVESLVVTETWFFRDLEPFTAFARLVTENWLPCHPVGMLRILSLPCSSGEEPYSLAMALADAGVPADRVYIEAVDLSARALKCARRGVYGKNAFRGADLAFRERHFQRTPEGYTLKASIRRKVHFYHGNLLSDSFSTRYPAYDFVFCRNLLIYFTDAARKKALRKIYGLLSSTGYLFLGPAEMPLAAENGFVSVDIPMGFVCMKKTSPTFVGSKIPAPRSTVLDFPPSAIKAVSRPQPIGKPQNSRPFENVRRLADEGRLDEAFVLCQDLLRSSQRVANRESTRDTEEAHLLSPKPTYSDTAELYYLMGLLHEARSRQPQARSLRRLVLDSRPSTSFDRAMECYRKALYLNPEHHGALSQSALLASKIGDGNAAALRGRLRRLEARLMARTAAGNEGHAPDDENCSSDNSSSVISNSSGRRL